MISVMVVEDHAVVRAGVQNLLGKAEGIEVIAEVGYADDALGILAKGVKPDIVLTDLHLGKISGIELAGQIREKYPEIKVIILTMETDEHYIANAFRAGVKGYLLKETDFDELIAAVRKVSQNKSFLCTGLAARLSKWLAKEFEYPRVANTNIDFSKRELEILQLLADGFTNIEIADKLFTSKRTVEGHRQSLLNKTSVKNTPELVKFALLHGLLVLPEHVRPN